ncbi:MAG: hypothetical protein KKB48_07680 [Gammaproteobacteria bacterium]|nr:glycosyltransferase family 4 protein [Sideroxydans sp.]MBU3904119.1 hypothetical protein [Gammaproteobacteria bacterium]
MNAQHERWLILSHCFNMDGRAASQTITDKLPHLMARGIDPIVLSGVSGSHDDRFMHLQLMPWGPAGLRFDMRHVVAMRFGRGVVYRILTLIISLLLAPFIVLERLMFGLQNHASWVFPATVRSLLLIRKYKPTVIYSTGGAYSAHLAGYWLKKLTGLPWIAEIHDPMVIEGQTKSRNARFMAKLEGIICKHADLVWWFTDGALERARRRHPELGERGIVVLPGAEPPRSVATYKRGEQMAICHFGSLATTRSLLPVVQALDAILGKEPELRPLVRVHVYGGKIDAAAMRSIEQKNLQDVFISHGRLEFSPETGRTGRERVVDLMYQADCLLLVHGSIDDCREYIPSKLYEYFWARRPVIALTHENPQLDKMVGERGGYVAPYIDASAAEAAIRQAILDWQADRLTVTSLPPLNTKQAVEDILGSFARLRDGGYR